MARWSAKPLREVPLVEKEAPGDPDWFPLQHHFGLTAFGVNVYVATAAGDTLLERHDETGSGQEELYLVTAGSARFVLDGEEVSAAEAPFVVAVPDAAVVREARALETGTTIVALGGEPRERFESSWQSHHFDSIPRV
jgi:hypothetical protein